MTTANGSAGSAMALEKGNTIPSQEHKKRITASKKWCFTYNNYDNGSIGSIISICELNDIKYIIGEEIGENGTPHLQGYIHSPIKLRPIEFFKIKEIHWEKAKGTESENITYCSKDKKYKTNILGAKKLKIIKTEELYYWQNEIINIIKKEPDDRHIYWYWCEKGNSGKTSFAKYLSFHFGAIPLEGKKNDVLYCASEFNSDIYIWDIERTQEDYISYGALEKIKNGYYMCAKYESKPIIRNPPHLIVFANFAPDYTALSKDRWIVKKLD